MHKLKIIKKFFDSKLDKKTKEQNKNKLDEGCFVYELEADSTIPSEYILLMHFLGEINLNLEKKIKIIYFPNKIRTEVGLYILEVSLMLVHLLKHIMH